MWITQGAQISLRLPKGPSRTEIWWFSMQQDGLSPDAARFSRTFSVHMFGPAGMFEQEDGENWALSTRAATVATPSAGRKKATPPPSCDFFMTFIGEDRVAGQEMLRLVDSVQGRFEGRFFRYRERRKK